MTRRRVDLVENGDAAEVALPIEIGSALADSGFVDARLQPAARTWLLRPLSKVGGIAIGGVEVHVRPKVPVDRLIALLDRSARGVTWQDAQIEVAGAPDLLVAVAEVYERQLRRSLLGGLLQGYRTVEEALPVVRGRIRETDQLRRRFGLPVPVEVRYDDYTADTAENRRLRTAVAVCRRMLSLPPGLAARLAQLDRQLGDVTRVRPRAAESWVPSRLNLRLQPALRLADVILEGASFEPGGDGLHVAGFIIDMARVFEDVVCLGLKPRLEALGGHAGLQASTYLDVDGEVTMRPDLVWSGDRREPLAVVDAKYKAERPSGFPDADLYQMLAYCTALGLREGHLVYAAGNEQMNAQEVRGCGVILRAHVLDLSLEPRELDLALDSLAGRVVVPAEDRSLMSRGV